MRFDVVIGAITSLTLAGLFGAGCASTPGPGQERTVSGENIDDSAIRIEAVSLLGGPLFPPEIDPERRAALEADLADAKRDFDADPTDEAAIIWYGRRLAYLGRYRDALNVFTEGLRHHPESFRLRRHSGHRLITLRRLDDAVADLTRAAELVRGVPDEVEPDGAPNPAGIPRSTTKTNIFYHLGLAHYLRGEFDQALTAYRECLSHSKNDDMQVAVTHWLYMTLRRLGRDDDAAGVLEPIHAEMEILENHAYHACLLMDKGERTPQQVLAEAERDDLNFASAGYGVAAWFWCAGEKERAAALWRRIVEETGWAAFGHIAAEAELAREGE